MKWVGITGSWRYDLPAMKNDIEREVSEIIQKGHGIVSGGALAADYIATETAINLDPSLKNLRIWLPAPLENYLKHYETRQKKGVITKNQLQMLSSQLKFVSRVNPSSLQWLSHRVVNKRTYYLRNKAVVEGSNELVAFHVNESLGTKHAISYAKRLGKPIRLYKYTI